MASYLFYDIETTGLNKAFDQVLQFAAIRTDMELQEIARHLIWVKLRPDVIPSPLASITHRIAITQSQQSLGEFEAIKQIHQLMNQPGTISLGYNTLSFDDELLRFCFHRNLLPPYTHQYHQGCRRMDMLPITNMYYLYKRDSLNWPEIEGKRSLRLEHLSKINQLATGMAHNALVDVEATVELARRFYRDTKMWRYVTGCFDKEIDRQRIETIPINFFLDTKGVEHMDYEYHRERTIALFMVVEPLEGNREVYVKDHHTRLDWAQVIAHLVEERYPTAKKLTLVPDNLSAHKKSAWYELFEPTRARTILNQIELVFTPKHGSWLNLGEGELSVLIRPGLKERIASKDKMIQATTAWYQARNDHATNVDWQFTTRDARIKLKRLYPSIKT